MKCCVEDCQAPATRHSQSPTASWYCDEHGVCPHCGDSVELFEPYLLENGSTIYICLCVKKALSTPLPPRPPIVYVPQEEKVETVRDHWSA
jgi:hypothetical protein